MRTAIVLFLLAIPAVAQAPQAKSEKQTNPTPSSNPYTNANANPSPVSAYTSPAKPEPVPDPFSLASPIGSTPKSPTAAADETAEPQAQSGIDRALDEASDDDADKNDPDRLPAGVCLVGAPGCNRHPFSPRDLEPYFDKSASPGYAAFKRHSYAKARQLLEQESATPPVRYLRAMAAYDAGDFATAAQELTDLAPEYPGLRDYCRYTAALALERLRQPERALDSYGGVRGQSSLFVVARMAMSRILERRQQLKAASVTMLPLVSPEQPPALQAKAWMRIADLSRKANDARATRSALLAVWATDPQSALASSAKARLGSTPIPLKWKVAHAEALINLHLNGAGMHALVPVMAKVPAKDPLGCRARFAYGQALRKEREHPAAIKMLEPLVHACGAAELTPRILYVLGYSQSVITPRAALDTYLQLATDYPKDDHADSALFLAADLMARAGNEDAALKTLDELVQRYPNQGLAAKALFQSFWIHRNRAELSQGLTRLQRLQRLPINALTFEDVQRAQYWEARTLEQLGQLEEARMRLEGIALDQAASYYGLLARLHLKEKDPERAEHLLQAMALHDRLDLGWPLEAGTMADEPHFRAGLELLRLGLPGAPTELLALDRTRLSGDSLLLLFHVLHAAGKDSAAELVARATIGLDERSRAPDARPLWEAAFPQKFRNLIEPATAHNKVPPDLMQALIREESGFNPKARSSTGAIGLAQLMPSTAGAVARRNVTASSLMNPKQNIRLGSVYMAGLLKRFAGNAALAVASYNAGPGAVEKWMRGNPDAGLDEFVESIPFDETRRYVKRVLGSFSTYEMLYRRRIVEAKADKSGASR